MRLVQNQYPDSLEKTALLTPAIKEPINPPIDASKLKALVKIELSVSGRV